MNRYIKRDTLLFCELCYTLSEPYLRYQKILKNRLQNTTFTSVAHCDIVCKIYEKTVCTLKENKSKK